MTPRPEIANLISEHRHAMAGWATHEFFTANPGLQAKWGANGVRRCTEDHAYHFAYLAEAVRFGFPEFFTDYMAWSKVLLHALRIGHEHLQESLALMERGLEVQLGQEARKAAAIPLNIASRALPNLPTEIPSFIKEDAPHGSLARRWLDLLLVKNAGAARQVLLQARSSGIPLLELYQHVLTPALHEVGRLWQIRNITEAEEHYCAHVTQNMLALLSADLAVPRVRKSVVGFSVGNEMHELGIRIVTDCFAIHGWDAVCLGSNVPTRNLDSILLTWNPAIIAISATMTYHLGEMQAAINAIKNSSQTHKPRIFVGGRPFNICPDLAKRLGADASAQSCAELISCAFA
ncbi:MAG TPA: cobalamin-dependent protein [Methylomirabilota bacterium]|nr:cobalamin-dependent protein [Methylomirabilota bacterium]